MNKTQTLTIIALIGVFASLWPVDVWAQGDYFSSRVGCFSKLASAVGANCTEQRLAIKALKALDTSTRANAKNKLAETIHKRADYFLAKKEFDYFALVSYMLFRPTEAESKILAFKNLPGKRAPFADIALARLKNERSSYCVPPTGEKSVAIFLREICTVEIKDL